MDQYPNQTPINPVPPPAPEAPMSPTPSPQIPPAPTRPTPISPLSIIALTFGILAVLTGLSMIGVVFGLVAVTLGTIALIKKVTGKKLALTAVITGAVGIIFGVGFTLMLANGVIKLPTGLSSSESTEKEIPLFTRNRALIESKKTFAKGETARFEYFDLKVNAVAEPFSDASSNKGEEYVFVNVTLTNKDTISQYTPEIKLNVNGTVYKEALLGPLKTVGSFQPGQSVTGDIRYAVKTGGTTMKLQLTKDGISNPDTEDNKSVRLVWTLAL